MVYCVKNAVLQDLYSDHYQKVIIMICETGFKTWCKDCIHLVLVYLDCFK